MMWIDYDKHRRTDSTYCITSDQADQSTKRESNHWPLCTPPQGCSRSDTSYFHSSSDPSAAKRDERIRGLQRGAKKAVPACTAAFSARDSERMSENIQMLVLSMLNTKKSSSNCGDALPWLRARCREQARISKCP